MKKILITLLIAFSPNLAAAERAIQVPFSETFNQNNYPDLVWLAEGNGATFTHLNSGCWSGGCAKFTPPTSVTNSGVNGAMAGLGHFTGLDVSRLNIRLLIKIGPSYFSTARNSGGGIGNKFIDVHSSNWTRLGILGLHPYHTVDDPPDTRYYTFGTMTVPSTAYYYTSQGGNRSDATFHIADGSNDYGGQWVAVEYEINNSTDTTKCYIWTQDGQFNGEYISAPSAIPANASYFYIGGYYNNIHLADPNSYMIIDELVVDDDFIGPPAEFGTGDPDITAPTAPVDLTVV